MARPEVAAVLAGAGLPAAQLDVVLLVMHAELEQVVVSGPMRGATHTYALLDDRVPTTAQDGADPVRLLRRYLAGHGPVERARLRPLVLAHPHHHARGARGAARRAGRGRGGGGDLPPPPGRRTRARCRPCCSCRSSTSCRWPTATWPSRRRPGHPHPPDVDLRSGSVVAGDANVGTWRREVKGRAVEVALDLAPGVPDDLRERAWAEAGRLADFLGRDLGQR